MFRLHVSHSFLRMFQVLDIKVLSSSNKVKISFFRNETWIMNSAYLRFFVFRLWIYFSSDFAFASIKIINAIQEPFVLSLVDNLFSKLIWKWTLIQFVDVGNSRFSHWWASSLTHEYSLRWCVGFHSIIFIYAI